MELRAQIPSAFISGCLECQVRTRGRTPQSHFKPLKQTPEREPSREKGTMQSKPERSAGKLHSPQAGLSLVDGFQLVSPRFFQSMMGKRSDNMTSCNKTAADPGSAHLDQPPAEAGTPEQVVQEHIQVGWGIFREGPYSFVGLVLPLRLKCFKILMLSVLRKLKE